MLLSPDVVRRYQEVGYAFLPQVIEPKWLALIEKGIQRNLDNPSPWSTAYQKSRGEFFSDHSNFSVNPEFQEVIYDSPMVDYMNELIGADRSWLSARSRPRSRRRASWRSGSPSARSSPAAPRRSARSRRRSSRPPPRAHGRR